MPRREDDDVAPRPGAPSSRTLTLAGGFALAVAATVTVLLTDDPQYLRLAVVAVAWAFVLAAFAAGRRGAERAAATAREAELRHGYERELEREVAARHEYGLELENELRRETEESVRYELDALRSDIAALAGLRGEVARVAALRDDVAAFGDLAQALRQDLGQVAELRAELTEQLSSEMLVERITMRTQASRLPADQGAPEPTSALEDSWTDDVPRELTGGWPAVRLDGPRPTQHVEQVRVDRAGQRPPVPARRPTPYRRRPPEDRPAAEPRPWDAPLPTPPWQVPPTTTWPAVLGGAPEPAEEQPVVAPPLWSSISRHEDPAPASRHAAGEALPAVPPTTAFPLSPPPAASPPAPLEWLAARSLLDPPTSPSLSGVPPRRRRSDDDRGAYRVAVHDEPEPEPATPGTRVAEILAENGVSPASGSRRRRRYREDDETDDVLARVLRGH